jgi:pyruvate kinase
MVKLSHKTNHWNQRTKIVCTLGPAVNTPVMIERLIWAGMNVARLNLSHGTWEEHAGRIRMVRESSARIKNQVAILLDLPGPKYRTGEINNNSAILKKGSRIRLTARCVLGDETTIPINFPSLYRDVKTGTTILLDDGAMQLRVESIQGQDVIARVTVAGVLTRGRGVVVPGAHISAPFLTPALLKNLDWAIQMQPDYIALSFVAHPDEVLKIKSILLKSGVKIPLISKIERAEALKNFDRILAVSEGVMVARGDLGVEIPLPAVPAAQKMIIRKCNRVGKSVITATQMLESMINAPRPTRAEVTDVANAILDGTDAVMLSAETSIGKYPVTAVRTMREIAHHTERHLPYQQLLSQRGQWLEHQTDELISYDACYTAYWLHAAAIVAFTQSGSTARRVSKYRPHVPIIAITPVKEITGQLELYWGVHAFHIDNPASIDDLFDTGMKFVKELGIAKAGDLIVITGGVPLGVTGTTNILKVQNVV